MFKFEELYQIHLEITNNCQASCPMCIRNIHGGIENPLIKLESWSLDRYKTIINQEVLAQVKSIYFCGNYGDPLLNNDLLSMIDYTKESNPEIEIRIHTNGSLRNKDWWKQLAQVMPLKHRVIFGIDGLEDTHEIYRVGTKFSKIIDNAREFINHGGLAEWAFIRFKHNQHQVDRAREMADNLGFTEFTVKDSSRFLIDKKFPVYGSDKQTLYYLEPSEYSEIKFIDKSVVQNYKKIVNETPIDCFALKHKEVYISAQGHLFPCCWLAMIPYQAPDEDKSLAPIRQEILSQFNQLIESLGGLESLSAEIRSIKEIINSPEYQSVWDIYWKEKKLITCVRSCGIQPEIFSKPKDQFVENLRFN